MFGHDRNLCSCEVRNNFLVTVGLILLKARVFVDIMEANIVASDCV
jgi:hypothetical protein